MRIITRGIGVLALTLGLTACWGAEESERYTTGRAAEAVGRNYQTLHPISGENQRVQWLEQLLQFRRIKLARDVVHCVGGDASHPTIRIADGYYALGLPGEAVMFYDNQCYIGVITDDPLE